MSKKVVILGGGTGTSTLVRGLKEFPVDISVVVSVSDDGRSTGRLREVFDIPAVGDLRQVLSALSETEPLFEKLLNYRFETNNDLNGHAIGNLLLAALCNITGNMSDGLKSLSNVLNLKGKVLPLDSSIAFITSSHTKLHVMLVYKLPMLRIIISAFFIDSITSGLTVGSSL